MTITDDRLRKLASLRGDKYQEEAEMARELLALRQSSPPDGQTAPKPFTLSWRNAENERVTRERDAFFDSLRRLICINSVLTALRSTAPLWLACGAAY